MYRVSQPITIKLRLLSERNFGIAYKGAECTINNKLQLKLILMRLSSTEVRVISLERRLPTVQLATEVGVVVPEVSWCVVNMRSDGVWRRGHSGVGASSQAEQVPVELVIVDRWRCCGCCGGDERRKRREM